MKNLIVAAYILPTFLRGADTKRAECLISNLSITKTAKWHEIRFTGDSCDLLFYAAVTHNKVYHIEEIVSEIKTSISEPRNVLILLHVGSKDPNFVKHIDRIDSQHKHVRIQGVSGGNGLFYHKLMDASGKIFPSLNNSDEFASNISSLLEEIWANYYNADDFKNRFEQHL